MIINAQEVDWNHLDETRLDSVIFAEVHEFSKNEWGDTLLCSSVAGPRIYRVLKRNHERLKLDRLDIKLNRIIRKFDSEITKRSGSIGSLGRLDSFSIQGYTSLKEVADKFITDWKNSPGDYFFMGWSQLGEAVTYYDRRTQVIYVFFVYFT